MWWAGGVMSSRQKSPVGPRPPAPRFKDITITSLPPFPSRDPRKSPVLRPTSPRSSKAPPHPLYFDSPIITRDRSKSTDVQRPSPLLVAPIRPFDPYPYCRQDLNQSGRASTSRHRTVTPGDNLCQSLDLTGQIAAGLAYLHSKHIIHGDVTGANVLINDTFSAVLADFGLSTIKAEFKGTSYSSSTVGGAIPMIDSHWEYIQHCWNATPFIMERDWTLLSWCPRVGTPRRAMAHNMTYNFNTCSTSLT